MCLISQTIWASRMRCVCCHSKTYYYENTKRPSPHGIVESYSSWWLSMSLQFSSSLFRLFSDLFEVFWYFPDFFSFFLCYLFFIFMCFVSGASFLTKAPFKKAPFSCCRDFEVLNLFFKVAVPKITWKIKLRSFK